MGSSCVTPAKPAPESDADAPEAARPSDSDPTLAFAVRKKLTKRPAPNKSPLLLPPPSAAPRSPEKEANEKKVCMVPSPKKEFGKTEDTPTKQRQSSRAPSVQRASTPNKHTAHTTPSTHSAPGSPERRKIPAAPPLGGSPREDFIGVQQCLTAPSILLQRSSSSRTGGSGNGMGSGNVADGTFRQGVGYRKSAKADEDEEEALQRVAALIRRMQQHSNAVVPSPADRDPNPNPNPSQSSPMRLSSGSSRGSRNSSAGSSIGSDLGGNDDHLASFHDSSSLFEGFGRPCSGSGRTPRLIDTPRTDLDLSVENAVMLIGNGGPHTLGRRKRSSINFSITM